MDHRGEDGGAVDDRGVHHLPLARGPGVQQRGQRAQGEEHSPAAEVAEQVHRRRRAARRAGRSRPARRSARCSRCRARRCATAARSAPSRSSGRRPAPGSRASSSSGPRPRRSITPGRKPSSRTSARRTSARTTSRSSASLRSSAIERLPRSSSDVAPRAPHQPAAAAAAVDADDVGAEVGQEHAAERPRPQPGELDDPHALQRSHGVPPLLPGPAVVRPSSGHAARRPGGGQEGPAAMAYLAGGARRRAGCARPLGRRRGAPLPRRLAVGDAAGQPHRLPAARRAARRSSAARSPEPRLGAAVPRRRRPRRLHDVLRRSPSRSCDLADGRRGAARRPATCCVSVVGGVAGGGRWGAAGRVPARAGPVTPLLVVAGRAGRRAAAAARRSGSPAAARARTPPPGTLAVNVAGSAAARASLLGLAERPGWVRGARRHRLLRHAHHLLDLRRRRRPARSRSGALGARRGLPGRRRLVLGLGAAAAAYGLAGLL